MNTRHEWIKDMNEYKTWMNTRHGIQNIQKQKNLWSKCISGNNKTVNPTIILANNKLMVYNNRVGLFKGRASSEKLLLFEYQTLFRFLRIYSNRVHQKLFFLYVHNEPH
jgi:hypothetical protein